MATTKITCADGTTLELDLNNINDCLKLFEKIKEFIDKDNILDSWISKDLKETFMEAKKIFKMASKRKDVDAKLLDNGDELRREIKKAIEKQSKVKYAFAFLWHKVIKAAALSVAGFVKKQVDKVTRAWARRQSRKADEKVAKIEKEQVKAQEKAAKIDIELAKAKEQQQKCRERLDELDPPTVDPAFAAEINAALDVFVEDLPSSPSAGSTVATPASPAPAEPSPAPASPPPSPAPAPAAVAASPVVSSTADPLAGGVASSRANTPPPSPSRSSGTPSPPASPSGGAVVHTVAASPTNPATPPHGSTPPSPSAPSSGAGAAASAGVPAADKPGTTPPHSPR